MARSPEPQTLRLVGVAPAARRAALPLLLAAAVLLLDVALGAGEHSIPVTGALDEPAHLATAAVLLLAVLGWRAVRRPRLTALVLVGAVVIDLDHIPLYQGVPWVAAGGRTVTHSLATLVVIAVVVALLPRRARPPVAALGLGVALHFVRDVATGPGLALLWPLDSEPVRLPTAAYEAVVVIAAVVAAVRLTTPRPVDTARPMPGQRRDAAVTRADAGVHRP